VLDLSTFSTTKTLQRWEKTAFGEMYILILHSFSGNQTPGISNSPGHSHSASSQQSRCTD